MLRYVFSRATKQPKGLTGAALLTAILEERPDLRGISPVIFKSGGQCAHTVFIGDEIFKAPKGETQIAQFDKEYETLKRLEGSGLPVPRVTCVGEKTVFYGMTRMAGVPAGGKMKAMTSEQQKALGKEVGNFVIEMEKIFPDADLASYKNPSGSGILDARAVLDRPEIIDMLGRERAALCRAVMDEYLPTLAGRRLVMTHGDLHGGNVLIDPETKRLSAIIDFGEARMSLPEANFIQPRFREGMNEAYAEAMGMAFDARAVASFNLAQTIIFPHAQRDEARQKEFIDHIDGLLELCKPAPSSPSRPYGRGMG